MMKGIKHRQFYIETVFYPKLRRFLSLFSLFQCKPQGWCEWLRTGLCKSSTKWFKTRVGCQGEAGMSPKYIDIETRVARCRFQRLLEQQRGFLVYRSKTWGAGKVQDLRWIKSWIRQSHENRIQTREVKFGYFLYILRLSLSSVVTVKTKWMVANILFSQEKRIMLTTQPWSSGKKR